MVLMTRGFDKVRIVKDVPTTIIKQKINVFKVVSILHPRHH